MSMPLPISPCFPGGVFKADLKVAHRTAAAREQGIRCSHQTVLLAAEIHNQPDSTRTKANSTAPFPRRAVPFVLLLILLATQIGLADERTIDPTFLRGSLQGLQEKSNEISSPTCHYKPVFGVGSPTTGIVKGIARFGEMRLDPAGSSQLVQYPDEEQVYLIVDGSGILTYGEQNVPVRMNDFVYLPPGVRHGMAGSREQGCRVIVMGFRVPVSARVQAPSKLLLANLEDVPKQTVAGHPPSVLYQLLVGDTKSTRDKIAAGHVLTSIYIMEFAPGGTNFPHHHETEEEVYLVLDGQGDMVAGGGMNGIEGRYPARAGDAYFFRLNCTAGFYNSSEPDARAHILGVRCLFPFSRH